MARPTRSFILVCATAAVLAGCNGKPMSLPPSAQATEQWNAARAGALASLAADQLQAGSFDKCQATLDQALRLQPNDVKLHLLAAKLSIEQGRLDLAEAHLAQARKLDATNAEADYLTGVLMERWQQPLRAEVAYADAVTKAPTEVAYLLAEAEMLVALKKPSDAPTLLQDKLSYFEHNGIVRHEIGLLLAAQGRTADAVAALREACRLMPDDPTVREHLAFTLFSVKQYAESGEVFDRLVKQSEYETRPDVFAALGECQSRTQRYVEAQKSYETATRLDASSPGYWLGLGRTALQSGDLPSADVAARKAVSLRPASAEVQCLVGYVRLKQNRLPDALTAFRKASELDANDSVSVCLQGYVLAKLGRAVEVRECYTRALKAQPDNALAGRLITSIDTAE